MPGAEAGPSSRGPEGAEGIPLHEGTLGAAQEQRHLRVKQAVGARESKTRQLKALLGTSSEIPEKLGQLSLRKPVPEKALDYFSLKLR